MTPDALLRLIASGESLDVEFKGEVRSPLSDDSLVETVVCPANRSVAATGCGLVGVEDDGRITGARPTDCSNGLRPPARWCESVARRKACDMDYRANNRSRVKNAAPPSRKYTPPPFPVMTYALASYCDSVRLFVAKAVSTPEAKGLDLDRRQARRAKPTEIG